MAAKTKNTKVDFCRSFEWKRDTKIDWYDTVGFIALSGDRVAKVELGTAGGHGDYSRFYVTIINKQTGIIDSKVFTFNDHLDILQRADGRADPKGQHYYPATGYYVVPHCGMDWYIAKPKTTKSLTSAIERYVDMFR